MIATGASSKVWNRQVRDLQKTVPPSIHKSVLAAVRFHDEWLMTGVRCYQLAVPFMVGWPSALAVHSSMPPSLSLALIENSLPSNSGCTPR